MRRPLHRAGDSREPHAAVLNLGDGTDGELLRSRGDVAATRQLSLKASTVTFYDGHLAQHILPALGNRKVRDLRRMDCRQLVRLPRQG